MAGVQEQVNSREEARSRQSNVKQESMRIPGIVLGVFIYSVGVNLFLQPLHLYSGGFMGFSQLIRTILVQRMGISFGNFDISGVIYYILNLPALIVAIRTMRKRFVLKTLFTVTCITLMLSLIPIPAAPIMEDKLANCIIAGVLAGGGIGLVLRMGACDGGVDLVGMILIQKKGRFSIGRINIAANLILYGLCLLLFDIPTVLYSLIYSVICSVACDKVHIQNINMQVLILTKMEDIKPLEIELMGEMHRGLTCWDAKGAYTDDDVHVLMCVISKYEEHQLKSIVHQIDPNAFVLIDEGVSIDGYFLKKLDS